MTCSPPQERRCSGVPLREGEELLRLVLRALAVLAGGVGDVGRFTVGRRVETGGFLVLGTIFSWLNRSDCCFSKEPSARNSSSMLMDLFF